MISEKDLLSYFAARHNRFTNKRGMLIGMGDAHEIWTHFNLCNYDRGPIAFDITTDYDSADEFISGFQIDSIERIDILDYNHSWARYLNGDATIGVTPMELEATLAFKIKKRKTIIFSLDLHFYDEVYEHLTLPEDFEQYISKYDKRLQAAIENRFKMNRI
jgi:hypothetical protein